MTPVYDCYGHTSPIKEDHFFDMDELNQLELDSRAPQDVPPEPIREGEAAHIYENYSFDHTYPADLPITKFQEQILQTIESNSVTVVQGEQLVLSIPGFWKQKGRIFQSKYRESVDDQRFLKYERKSTD